MKVHKSFKPDDLLVPYIDRYFIGNTCFESSVELYPLLPGTGVDVFIHNAPSFAIEGIMLQPTHIICSRRTFQLELHKNKTDFIAIRFRSGAFRHFSPINFNELNNTFLSVNEIWKQEGATMAEQITGQPVQEKIRILNIFFLAQLTKYKKEKIYLDHAISSLYADPSMQAGTLANQYGISYRHLERCFTQEFGITPKKFQRIARFQSAIKKILLQEENTFSVILEEGYYDQAHFIKECRDFTGNTPSELFNNKEQKYHFYHNRLA